MRVNDNDDDDINGISGHYVGEGEEEYCRLVWQSKQRVRQTNAAINISIMGQIAR